MPVILNKDDADHLDAYIPVFFRFKEIPLPKIELLETILQVAWQSNKFVG